MRGSTVLTRSLIVGACAAGLLAGRADAASPPRTPVPILASTGQALLVEAGSGRVVALPSAVSNVFVSDPKIAEVRPASPTSLFVFGVAVGRTTVAALDGTGNIIRQYEVTVRASGFGAAEAASTIARTIPSSAIRIEAHPKRLTMSGRAATPADANAAVATTASYLADGQTVDNRMTVGSQIQVGLRVRIAEMSRNVTRSIGINWQAIGSVGQIAVAFATNNVLGATTSAVSSLRTTAGTPSNHINNFIDALAGDNLVHILAEPNLTAMSGESASFLVGGEFPIPIAQTNGSTTVDFKQYGVALSFVPTVLSENRIRLHVRPEVSQLTNVGAVQVGGGITIPALSVRRAETTIELGSGQSFAMAGLLQDQTTQTVNALPGIGEVPILGALFRSDAFVRNETELVIIVTPYIVRPTNDPTALKLSTDGFRPANDLERILLLRQTALGSSDPMQRLPGQAGFVVE